jgi:hypothetical protein
MLQAHQSIAHLGMLSIGEILRCAEALAPKAAGVFIPQLRAVKKG